MTQRNADLITKYEAASILGKSLRTVDRYLADLTLTPLKYRDGRVVVRRVEVEALLLPIAPVVSPLTRETAGASSISGGAK